jgi:hypothetical protein
MNIFWIFTGLLLVAAVAITGCTTSSLEDIDTDQLAGDIRSEISGVIAPETSVTSESNRNWVLWSEVGIGISKGGYSYTRPNDDQRLFKDLKVTIEADGPVDIRFTTLKQSEDYMNGWRNFHEYETTSSFNPQDVGYVKIYEGISEGSVEAHSDEGLIIFIEPHLDKPAKGTMKIYYKP